MNWKKRLLTLTLTLGLLGTALAGCTQPAGDSALIKAHQVYCFL